MWRVTGHIACAGLFFTILLLGLTGCGGDSGPTPSGLTITTTSLPVQTVNRPYSASVSASGGTPPYTWSVSPTLPSNLTFDTATGAIGGTPTTAATTTHTFTVRDTSTPLQVVEQTLTLTILPPLSITTTVLPDASIAAAYNQPIETVGGMGALSFSIVQPGTGALPSTLSLDPTTGMISGTPTAPAGTFPFTVRVADTTGQQDTQALAVRVTPTTPPNITTTSLPNGTTGQSYSFRVQATGGIGTLAWRVSAGSLPPGLILNPSGPTGGTISGTPTSGGTFNFSVTITDSVGQTDTQALSITVAPLSITTTSLPSGIIGQAYNQALQATGGIGTLTWSIDSRTLPLGLTLSPAGVISGTPLAPPGPSSFTVRVIDTGGQSDTRLLSIRVDVLSAPNITNAPLQAATVTQPYNQPLQLTGGFAPFTWNISAGSLPQGLSLSPAGVISGIPLAPGPSTFTVMVKDLFQQTDTQDFTLTVSALLEITTTSLPNAIENQAYTATLQSTGGNPPVSWSVDPPLPAGLSLNQATGEISGTPPPMNQGSHLVTFTARDSRTPPQIVTKQLDLRVDPP